MQVTEPLKDDILLNLRNLTNRRNELLIKIGQLFVDLKFIESELESSQTSLTNEEKSFRKYLDALKIMYPNGDIDLANGTITYTKTES
jgi:hypothetical protein